MASDFHRRAARRLLAVVIAPLGSLLVSAAVVVFVWLGLNARVPDLAMNFAWVGVLAIILIGSAVGCTWVLWKSTRFS